MVPSSLKLSSTEVAPNQSVIISGKGFNENAKILVSDITIDGEPLEVTPRWHAGNRHRPVHPDHQQW